MSALEQEQGPIDLIGILQAIRHDAKTIILIALVVCALSTVVAFLLPPKYTSEATFIPPNTSGNTSVAAALAGQLNALGAGSLMGTAKSSGDLYAGILKSRSIASEIVERFHLQQVYKAKKESQAEIELASHTNVIVGLKDTIVAVAVTEKSPDLAHDIANAYLDALRETQGRLALTESSQRRLFFGQQLAKEKDDLEDAEVELKKTEEHTGLIAPAGQTESEIKSIADLRAQVALREVQLAALRQSATDQNANVVRLRSEIGDLQGQLSRLQADPTRGLNGAIPTSKVPELQLEYVRKEREVKYHETLFEMLSRQYEAARMDEAHDAPLLQILDPASYPDAKSSPHRLLIIAGGLIGGMFAGCLWVLTRGRMRVIRSLIAKNEPS